MTGLGTQESLEDVSTESKGPLRGGCQHRPVLTPWALKMQKKAGPEGPEVQLGLRGFSQTPCREPKEVLCPHRNSGTPSQVRPANAKLRQPHPLPASFSHHPRQAAPSAVRAQPESWRAEAPVQLPATPLHSGTSGLGAGVTGRAARALSDISPGSLAAHICVRDSGRGLA